MEVENMQDISNLTMDGLVEHHRLNSQSEPSLRELPRPIGRLLSAMSYMETYAGQIIGPWVEGAMDAKQLLDFSVISSFDRVEECAAFIDKTLDALKLQHDQDMASLAERVDYVWEALKNQIKHVRECRSPNGFAFGSVKVFIASMAMRQDAAAHVDNGDGKFAMESSSTCRQFMENLAAKIGALPFGCYEGMPLHSLCSEIVEDANARPV